MKKYLLIPLLVLMAFSAVSVEAKTAKKTKKTAQQNLSGIIVPTTAVSSTTTTTTATLLPPPTIPTIPQSTSILNPTTVTSNNNFTFGGTVTISWTSQNSDYCVFTGDTVLTDSSEIIKDVHIEPNGSRTFKVGVLNSQGQLVYQERMTLILTCKKNSDVPLMLMSNNSIAHLIGINPAPTVVTPASTGVTVTSTPTTPVNPPTGATKLISQWPGKVNQHSDDGINWSTDPQGDKGAETPLLAYCKKFWPGTTDVKLNNLYESIPHWMTAGNAQDYGTSIKPSFACIQ